MAHCPGCGTASGRVHSRYRRRLADAAIAGRAMVLLLVMRRFFCANTDCAAWTSPSRSTDSQQSGRGERTS
ncbi:transposase family protein [Nocardia gipuzkoensis]|uniref:transposase family protein n=1 Tax=Nocardia gipuzkoensis TaxID=2749991 RepID=UPI003EE0B92E